MILKSEICTLMDFFVAGYVLVEDLVGSVPLHLIEEELYIYAPAYNILYAKQLAKRESKDYAFRHGGTQQDQSLLVINIS